jgi:hypothetical protein
VDIPPDEGQPITSEKPPSRTKLRLHGNLACDALERFTITARKTQVGAHSRAGNGPNDGGFGSQWLKSNARRNDKSAIVNRPVAARFQAR